ncbi:MAG: beta-galactosidase trimerization domain-containing protein [Bacteroidales bacterium]
MRKTFFQITFIFFSIFQTVFSAEITPNSCPVIGGQVIIEKGQSREEIESLFVILKNNNMNFCRIRMFESYMHDGNGNWDFSTFDLAFQAAERNNITIIATLFPMVEFTNIGGFKFPDSDAHLASIAEYIKQVVGHFKQYKSLYGWVLMNEIGCGKAPFNKPLTAQKFAEWQKADTIKAFNDAGKPIIQFQEERFLLDYNSWYLNWLKSEVKKYDAKSHLHVNTHAVFDTYAEYDFTKWRTILDSFGGSAHASWHFGNFTRNNYHYAIAANSEIIRSGSGNKPWIMTELQGGNNLWSGGIPMCPTKQEIEQWMWTIIGSGGKGMIFWSLNGRSAGIEAAEWSLLNLLNQSTERLEMAGKVSGILKNCADIFSTAKEYESGVNILYTRESLWCERRAETTRVNYAGRLPGGSIRSAIGFFETLSQLGIQTNLKCIDEFDFTANNNKGKVLILPHQIAVPSKLTKSLEQFVATGGTLLVEGLTGFFDENMHNQTTTNFPYANLFGGMLKDAPFVADKFSISLANQKSALPAHLWEGVIQPTIAQSLAKNAKGGIVATTNIYGNGKVIWIPSLVGIAARETNNYLPLSQFIIRELLPQLYSNTIRFKAFTDGVLMKTLRTDSGYVVVLINKSLKTQRVELLLPNAKPIKILNAGVVSAPKLTNKFMLSSEETKVIEFQKIN